MGEIALAKDQSATDKELWRPSFSGLSVGCSINEEVISYQLELGK